MYTANGISNSDKLNRACYYSKDHRTVYQPWGFPDHQIKVENNEASIFSDNEYFVGSIWDNDLNQGNINEIENFKAQLFKNSVNFVHCKGLPDFLMGKFIRYSRYAMALVGKWQAQEGYMPCRLFKNMNYGRVGLINSVAVNEELNLGLPSSDVSEMLVFYDNLSLAQKKELHKHQTENILHLSYTENLKRIVSCFSS